MTVTGSQEIIMNTLKFQKFYEGDPVKIMCIIDDMTSKELIGKRSIIEEVDDLPNGDYNYTLADGTYIHEEELEFDVPRAVIQRLKQ